MNDIAVQRPLTRLPVPPNVAVRAATPSDLPFIDRLQKQHAKQVGWMPTKQLEGKIKLGHVIVAEDGAQAVGYCIGNDQYFKRDDVGIIYQMNVVPDRRRSLIGATLVKAMFERAAYGCRLFCCWCAQDIEANRFWESLGFVPLAFRAGSREKGRVHIFWQRRIRAGDTTTPYWFPSQTTSGSIREDRLVFPIPPGVHWSEAMPVVLPREKLPAVGGERPAPTVRPPTHRRVQFGRPSAKPQPPPATKPKRAKAPKLKNDPKLVAAARELRDRWLEQVNAGSVVAQALGRYDVGRELPAASTTASVKRTPLLEAA
jgi:N-acetylglutamate synthase-like GNAT family acetyltransferase